MITRPTERWRREAEQQQAAVAARTISADEAWAPELWPLSFTEAIESVLAAFERDATNLKAGSDDDVWAVVKRVVLALNDADEDGHIETGEREALCDYIDQVLTTAGVDIEGLAARRGIRPAEITDAWRDW